MLRLRLLWQRILTNDNNHNFAYDHAAYDAARKGGERLVEFGELDTAKQLAIELMKKGIYQVVCSDEGMMTEEFEDCLKPVIKAVRSVGGVDAKRWARTMLSTDKAGYVLLRKLAEGR